MKNLFSKSKDDAYKSANVDRDEKIVDDKKLSLRGEELDVSKNRVKVGEVEFGKEIVEEVKKVDIPVKHEELIIERHVIDNERSDSTINPEEIIHIPLSKEVVNVDKHTVVTGEVSVRKKEVEDTHHISESLKKEEARINKDGDVNILSDNDNGRLK